MDPIVKTAHAPVATISWPRILPVVLLALLLAACDSTLPGAAPASVTGTWDTTLQAQDGNTLPRKLVLQQSGAHITGVLTTILGTSGCALTGTAGTDSVSLKAECDQKDIFTGGTFHIVIRLDGTLSDAQHMSGTYTETDTPASGGAPSNGSGNWYASKTA